VRCWRKSSPVGAAVCENKRVRRPGVAGAHMQRIARLRANLPGRVQVVNIFFFVSGCCGMWIVGGEAFVDVAIIDDGLWRRRVLRGQRHVGLVAIERRCRKAIFLLMLLLRLTAMAVGRGTHGVGVSATDNLQIR
jgi:hypothetical protein